MLSPRVEEADYRVRPDVTAVRPGHWVHLSAYGPVHGALAWWPCGASETTWIATGSFVSWKPGPQLPGNPAASLWLETERFGTGLQVRTAHWAMPGESLAMVVWQGHVAEHLSGPDQVEVHRQLLPQQAGRWRLVERRSINGRSVSVADQVLCTSSKAVREPATRPLQPCTP